MKKFLITALVSLAILPGCGKKNNDAPVNVATAPAFTPIGGGVGGAGGCAALNYNTAQTITFYGQIGGYSGVTGNLQVYSYGSQRAGYAGTYNRSNVAGDSLNVYVSGQQAYAVVTLAANTVNAIIAGSYSGYGGSSGQLCGLYINASIVQNQNWGSFTGNLSGTIAPLGNGGNYIRYPNSSTPILL